MTLTKLTEELWSFGKKNFDGKLALSNEKLELTLYICCGKLVYAKDKHHPVRRFSRALRQHGSKWNWGSYSPFSPDNQPWEYYLINHGIEKQELSLLRSKLVIRTVVYECLFELSNHKDIDINWLANSTSESQTNPCQTVALSDWETQALFSRAKDLQNQWQDAGLKNLSPSLSPILKEDINSQLLPVEDKYINGKFTLWDLALQLDKPVIETVKLLLPLQEKGILKFQPIPDLPIPSFSGEQIVKDAFNSRQDKSKKSSGESYLIACIDDSPVLAHTLKKILTSVGYEMLSIPEPMRGFTQLIENKPDLILLDLLLPNADGYSICKFLRDSPVFEKTPIIILTGRNTPIDRVRAKLVGATEFLAKPPQTQELIQILQKYLKQ